MVTFEHKFYTIKKKKKKKIINFSFIIDLIFHNDAVIKPNPFVMGQYGMSPLPP
jgi:hypothetical protein